jgi:hypothetical protein
MTRGTMVIAVETANYWERSLPNSLRRPYLIAVLPALQASLGGPNRSLKRLKTKVVNDLSGCRQLVEDRWRRGAFTGYTPSQKEEEI